MDNMRVWNAVKQPPIDALKPIIAGRLKGKSDINPQWRYKVMTEQFGICGIGWKYEIARVWNEPASENQIFAFAEINLYVKQDNQWSDPIPGTGGSMLVEMESKGLHSSDEGYKMAITDALGVAMKMLGVAADIYAGLFDGSKYQTEKKPSPVGKTEDKKETPQPGATTPEHFCTEHNVKFFKTEKMKSYAHPIQGTKEWCHEHRTLPDTSKSSDTSPASTSTSVEDELFGKHQTEANINWGRVNKLSAKMGLKSVVDMNKAMKVKSPSEWIGTENEALDRIHEYAQLNGYQGAPWREIEL